MSRFLTVSGRRWEARGLIDEAAGAARLRYITDVPGQQAVYMLKLAQAQAYTAAVLLDAGATVPPYIAAEAAALGQTAAQVSATVIALAGVWNDQLGPAIEGARLGGKAAVTAAATPEAVQTACDAAIAALGAL